jgi:4a-hydroxytetrahydrobiopterin dehydratase
MGCELAAKTCVPCRGGIPAMPLERAEELLAQVPGWRLLGGGTKIERAFRFEDFASAMRFANRVADLAEQQGHHPDLAVGWGCCTVTTYTHKIGGLHENDFVLAAKVNELQGD